MEQIEYKRKGRILREELFVKALCCYPTDPTFNNMSEAARKAGYKGKYIGMHAAEIAKRPKIKAAIDSYRAKMMQEFDISPKKIIQEIAATAFSNFQDFYSDDGTLKPVSKLPRHCSAALQSIEAKYSLDEMRRPEVIQKIRLYDKLKSLEMLGKYYKLWTEGGDATTEDAKVSQDEKARLKQEKYLAQLTEDPDDGKE